MPPQTSAAIVGAISRTNSDLGTRSSKTIGGRGINAWSDAESLALHSGETSDSKKDLAQTAELAEALMPNEDMKSGLLAHLTHAIKKDGQEDEQESNPAHWFVENNVFKAIVMIFIILNAIMMGVEVDTQDWSGWKAVNHTFAAVFIIEMIIKLIVLRLEYFSDRWNWLDCILGLLGFIDTWVMTMFQQDDAGLQTFTTLRLLRLVRLVRLVRLFRSCVKLIIVMKSIVDAIQTTCWVTFVLSICIYVCAIFCVEIIGHAPTSTYPGYTSDSAEIDEQEIMVNFNPKLVFGNMASAMLTLFNVAIFAEWTEVVRPIWVKQPGMIIFFVLFAIFVCFGVMNVIIGMIMDNVMENARAMHQEEEHFRKVEKLNLLEDLQRLIFTIDSNQDKKVDKAELEECLRSNAEIHSVMDRAKLPYHLTAKELLSIVDNDGDGVLNYEEFIGSFYRLINSDGFQQMCLIQMGLNEIKSSIRDVVATMTHRFDKIELGLQGKSWTCEGSNYIGVPQTLRKGAEVREPNRQDSPHFSVSASCKIGPLDVQSCLNKVQQAVGNALQQKLEYEFNELLNVLRLDDRFSHGAVESEDAQKRRGDVMKDEDIRGAPAPPTTPAPHLIENSLISREQEHGLSRASPSSEAKLTIQEQHDRQQNQHPHQNVEW